MDSSATIGYSSYARLYDSDTSTQRASVRFQGSHIGLVEWGTPDTFYSNSISINHSKINILLTSAGTHTIKLQARSSDGGTTRISDADFGYVILGI